MLLVLLHHEVGKSCRIEKSPQPEGYEVCKGNSQYYKQYEEKHVRQVIKRYFQYIACYFHCARKISLKVKQCCGEGKYCNQISQRLVEVDMAYLHGLFSFRDCNHNG